MMWQSLKGYRFERVLGQGAFGTVYKAVNKEGQDCVVKFLRKNDLVRHRQLDHLRNEVQCMSLLLGRSQFVQLEGVWESHKFVGLVLELIEGLNIPEYLCLNSLERAEVRMVMLSLVRAVKALHSKLTAHRDIKPENLILTASGQLKVVDFGLAKRLEHRTYTVCGTGQYMAPEVLSGGGHELTPDWWSVGVLLFELAEGHELFSNDDPLAMVASITDFNPQSLQFKKADAMLSNLIVKLLQPDISKRLGCSSYGGTEVENHPYFSVEDGPEVALGLQRKVEQAMSHEFESIEPEIAMAELLDDLLHGQAFDPSESIFYKVDRRQ